MWNLMTLGSSSVLGRSFPRAEYASSVGARTRNAGSNRLMIGDGER